MISFQRQTVFLATIGLILGTLLLSFYTSSFQLSADAALRLVGWSPYPTRQLHLVLPATATNLNFCRLLLTSTIAGYPEPVLLGWGGHGRYDGAQSHLFKISETLAYLDALPPVNDNDVVLLLDAYDVWLLLRPEVLISRYFELVKRSNRAIVPTNRQHPAQVSNTIFFGADKTCWPDDARRAACWSVPESPLEKYTFGPDTDTWMVPSRPKWLNSGTILGPVRDMRAMFNATMATVDRDFNGDYEFRNSDQYYFQEVWAAQEVGRMKLRDPKFFPPVVGYDESGRDVLGIVPGPINERSEYHISIDHKSDLFMAAAAYTEYLTWMSFNHTTSTNVDSVRRPRLDELQLPLDIARSSPPFKALAASRAPESKRTWADVILGTNVITQNTFPVLHLTGDKGYRDQWWCNMWFHPHGKALLAAIRGDTAKKKEAVIAVVDGVRWIGANASKIHPTPLRRPGGAWSDQGFHLDWADLCASHEDKLFL